MGKNETEVFEFRGVDNLHIAEIIKDNEEEYVTGEVIYLSPVAEIGKNTETSNEARYYDNKAMMVVSSESADTIQITLAPPTLDKLAMIIGKSFDESTGMLVDGERDNKYFALMYRTKGTDGAYRYVVRHKGTFSIPEESSKTEDNGTDTTNTAITYTGIFTKHQFEKGRYDKGEWKKGSVKGIVIDTRYNMVDMTNFFESVATPDSVKASTTTIE